MTLSCVGRPIVPRPEHQICTHNKQKITSDAWTLLPSGRFERSNKKFRKQQWVIGGRDICRGDSGSALWKWTKPLDRRSKQAVITGIASLSTCGMKDEPSVFTQVKAFDRWIKSHVKKVYQSCEI